MQIGFHTDAFNSSYWNFEQCLRWANRNGVRFIECGSIDGVSWIHGLGYQPHIALWEDPLMVRRKMESYGVSFSQLDAAFPLSRPEGATLGVEYILHTMRWAKLAGCPRIDTTDDRDKPAGATDREVLDHMRRIYRQVLPFAEAYGIVINIEPHGYYTTRPEFMAEMLSFSDSPFLRMNMDTGNTFIAGQDPVAFLERFKDKVDHVHIKDVSKSLAAAMRGELTGIAVSQCAVGEGVNAENIRRCLAILAASGYDGVLSLECEGHGGPMIERSLAWLRSAICAATTG
ncbi:MAG TPA: sugar phosphate isomerase/epimerase [Bryobacteraceae bacterium]|nr:sugar phosphate isomerase/epimerase [Bryobacteraceae bacterium]HOQ46351.1 sugar phosphate isomerase/epimerase [Bryobacteraceae bacterium]HPU72212.1 sugar phosphate isomerase/epimerase [Bryobacteraceae bacterium]